MSLAHTHALRSLMKRERAIIVSRQLLDEHGQLVERSPDQIVSDLRVQKDAIAFLPAFSEEVAVYGIVRSAWSRGGWILWTTNPRVRLTIDVIRSPSVWKTAEAWIGTLRSRAVMSELETRIDEAGRTFKAKRIERWHEGVASRRAARAARGSGAGR